MSQSLSTTLGSLSLAAVFAASPPLSAPPDTDQLAQRLVAGAAVKEGETVMISGQVRDAQLLEDIAVNVR
jgi:hypothetical protein